MENQECPSSDDFKNVVTSENGEPFWKVARGGVSLLLNNKQNEAGELFKRYPDSIIMYSGYATVTFMDALMSYEDDKLALASQTLKETERRCSGSGWFKSIKSKAINYDQTYAEHLEMQIIRADSQMYMATLTFLQQDISAYFKGGWMLRKSWKHYQQTYNEILSLYKQIVGEPVLPITIVPTDIVSSTVEIPASSKRTEEVNPAYSDLDVCDKNELLHSESRSRASLRASDETKPLTRNGYNPLPKSTTLSNLSVTLDPKLNLGPSGSKSAFLKKSQSSYSFNQATFSNLYNLSDYLTNLNPFSDEFTKPIDIDKETITRLMCGVSFGFGLLQLGMSLLPPSILKLTNFLGFQGNRKAGLANLMYARSGEDMRAPLATLALLWYHTIVRPFFALDGNNVQAGVDTAANLINEATEDYADSSIFLFFKGRVDRLKSDIPSAIESFTSSIQNSTQREIKILSQHEVGWCYLIQLDYEHSMSTFKYLKQQSRWSRGFYAYLCTISAGSNGTLKTQMEFDELKVIFQSTPRGTQLDEFLGRRFKICPSEEKFLISKKITYWKLLVFELLYLWNSLPSCNLDNVNLIIKECHDVIINNDEEPFIGLSDLIAGSAQCTLREYDKGVAHFRSCLEKRKTQTFHSEDAHVSAFALYELGQLLIRNEETKAEGKQCLQQVHNYKDYDFEQRLSVRICSILKHL